MGNRSNRRNNRRNSGTDGLLPAILLGICNLILLVVIVLAPGKHKSDPRDEGYKTGEVTHIAGKKDKDSSAGENGQTSGIPGDNGVAIAMKTSNAGLEKFLEASPEEIAAWQNGGSYDSSVDAEQGTAAGNEETFQGETDVPQGTPDDYDDIDGIEGIVDLDKENQTVYPSFGETNPPTISDFMWYFNDVYYNGTPQDAEFFQDPGMQEGSWKGFVWYDPDSPDGNYVIEFCNLDINILRNTAFLMQYMSKYYVTGQDMIDISNEVYDYSGSWDGGIIECTGPGVIRLEAFYTRPGDKKQYAIGRVSSPDGTPTVIALVRP